jgi:hypothetical protein
MPVAVRELIGVPLHSGQPLGGAGPSSVLTDGAGLDDLVVMPVIRDW